jgi:hypothetical protein
VDGGARRLRRLSLRLAVAVDARPVLRARVVALAHALRRVVALPEHLQQVLIANHPRVEDHPHDLVVSGHAGADLAVGRVRGVPGRVAGRGRADPLDLPELALRAPEAAQAEHGRLHAGRERRRHRSAGHHVLCGHRHPLAPPRQRLLFRRHLHLVRVEFHGAYPGAVLARWPAGARRSSTPTSRSTTHTTSSRSATTTSSTWSPWGSCSEHRLARRAAPWAEEVQRCVLSGRQVLSFWEECSFSRTARSRRALGSCR